ncbi:MAG: hypothetical protein M5R36_06175 [Deltaproteobacteria bacterium]|nr:hypothetical protein [Deltaproteobacteria bacterium]
MKFRFLAFLTLMAAMSIPASAFGGAWTAGRGKGYQKLGVSYFTASEYFDNNSERGEAPENQYFQDLAIGYYGSVGLTDWLDAILNLAYKHQYANNGLRTAEYAGPGDQEAALKARLFQKPFVFSTQVTYKSPHFYDENAKLPPGSGQQDVEGRLLLGRSLYPLPLYFGLEGGYRWRDEEPSDEWRYLVELGGNFWRVFPRVKLDGIASVGNADEAETTDPQAGLESAIGRLESALDFQILNPLFLEVAYTTALYGRNAAAGHTYSAAVIFTF